MHHITIPCTGSAGNGACLPVMASFPPPLRSGGNAALSGGACLSPPQRCGENQAPETDAPSGYRSAPHYAFFQTEIFTLSVA